MRPSRSDLRGILDYLRATENEIAVDKVAYAACGITPSQAGYLPRPSKWFHKTGSRLPLLRLGGRVLAGLWPWGVGALFSAVELLFFLSHIKFGAGLSVVDLHQASYGLGFSSRAADVIRKEAASDAPTCWFALPWAPLATSTGARQFDALALLRIRDLLAAYLLAVRAIGAMSRCKSASAWVLQSYTAFRWFAVRAALAKLSGTFWTAEHFDRWAVLADSVVREKRRYGLIGAGTCTRLVLVQHGIVEGALDSGATGFPYELAYQLKAVDSVYVYDQPSSTIFTKRILAPATAAAADIRFFKPRLALAGRRQAGKIGILFVGHPVCERLHLFLYDRLRDHPGIHVFYKPHPTSSASSAIKNESWEFISDKVRYPAVDVLIAYPSTLVKEYAAYNVDALVHPLNLDVQHAGDFLRSVESWLELRNTIES